MHYKSDEDTKFDHAIENLLGTGSTILNDFKTFSSFFKSHTDSVSGLVDILFVSRALCRILNQKWNNEEFEYRTGRGLVFDTGEFDFTFYGSIHTLRLHAYIDNEKAARHGSVYKVDVRADERYVSGVCMTWCPCC